MAVLNTVTAEAAAEGLAWLSRYVDAGLEGRDPEAITLHRLIKIQEEAGEVVDAVIGATGANPRKGYYGGFADVVTELLDVATAALGAVEHIQGNCGDALASLFDHITDREARAITAQTRAEGNPKS